MKHRVYGKHFGRDKDERNGLFKSLVQSLILRGSIETSSTKAGAIKGLVDKIINLAKSKDRQYLLKSYLVSKDLQERLIKEIVPKVSNRTSGYTSLLKLGTRLGDNTMMVRMSLIGAEELKPLEKGIGRVPAEGGARQRRQGTVKKTVEVKKVIPQKKVETKKPVIKKKVANKK